MLSTQHKTSYNYHGGGLKLPQLGSVKLGGHRHYDTLNHRANLTQASSRGMIHRSVPPSGELPDMLPFTPMTPRYKTNPVAANTPTEFATRFKARPTTTPKIIGLESTNILPGKKYNVRGVNGFFPPVKLRSSPKQTPREQEALYAYSMDIEPPTPGPTPRPQTEHGKTMTDASSIIFSTRSKTNLSKHNTDSEMKRQYSVHNPQTLSFPYQVKDHDSINDLCELPKPKKKLVCNKDTPWVYRYKVKKNMNRLAKIMASKTPYLTENLL